MGYRLGVEERFAPQNLSQGLTNYNPLTAKTTQDRLDQYSREQQVRDDKILAGTEEMFMKPVKAFQNQMDRNRAAKESDKKMELVDKQKALSEEQILSSAQQRALEVQYGGTERQSRIDASRSSIDANQQQIKANQFAIDEAQQKQDFENQPAVAANLPGALPDETVRTYNLRNDAQSKIDGRNLIKYQIAAQQDAVATNAVQRRIAQLGIDEQERTNRVRDLQQRLSLVTDPLQSEAIITDLGKIAKPAELAEAMNNVKSNRAQSAQMQTMMQRTDTAFQHVVRREMEAKTTSEEVAGLVAVADEAIKNYGDARTPWSDNATDAVKALQSQLRASGMDAQADDLENVFTGWALFGETRQDRLKQSLTNLTRTLGSEFQAKYGHLNPSFENFGKQLKAKSFNSMQGSDGRARNIYLQGASNQTLPQPTFSPNSALPGLPGGQQQQQMPMQMHPQTMPVNFQQPQGQPNQSMQPQQPQFGMPQQQMPQQTMQPPAYKIPQAWGRTKQVTGK